MFCGAGARDVGAFYLGALCANVALLASPERIVLSGGVMQRDCLFPKTRQAMQQHLKGYIHAPQVATAAGLADFVAPSRWGNSAGIVGALTLAQKALKREQCVGAGGGQEQKRKEREGVAAYCVKA